MCSIVLCLKDKIEKSCTVFSDYASFLLSFFFTSTFYLDSTFPEHSTDIACKWTSSIGLRGHSGRQGGGR